MDTNGDSMASVELYDPASESWTGTDPMSNARRLHTASRFQSLAGERILVAGGIGFLGSTLDTAEIYDPQAGSNPWTSSTIPGGARAEHTATVLAEEGIVLIAGGRAGTTPTNIVNAYDVNTNAWSVRHELLQARHGHAAAVVNGTALVMGGSGVMEVIDGAEIYNVAKNNWTPAGVMGHARVNHAAVTLDDGRVLVVGGGSADAELFDPTNPSKYWSPTSATADVARSWGTATLLLDGRVLVAGGFTSSTRPEKLYDPANDTWSSVSAMNTRRAAHTATRLQSGAVLVVGGNDGMAPHQRAEIFELAKLGEPCTGPQECASGFCVSLVCCSAACTNDTQDPCGNDGQCNAAGECRKFPAGTQCQPVSCSGTKLESHVCDGNGTCGVDAVDCAPGTCKASACSSDCATGADCASSAYCDGTTCKPKQGDGAACSSSDQCASGSCSDGACRSDEVVQGFYSCVVASQRKSHGGMGAAALLGLGLVMAANRRRRQKPRARR